VNRNGAVLSDEKRAELLAAARGVRRNTTGVAMGVRVTAMPGEATATVRRPARGTVQPNPQPDPQTESVEALEFGEVPTEVEEQAPVVEPVEVSVPPAIEAPTWPTAVEDLLAKAATSENTRTQALGEKVRAMLADLAGRVDAEESERQLLAEIAELEQVMAAKRGRLRGLRRPAAGPPTATPTADSAESTATAAWTSAPPSPKEIRAWARTNGVECNALGRVPQHVVDAYLAATGREATA
jgi:Lsr2 protein